MTQPINIVYEGRDPLKMPAVAKLRRHLKVWPERWSGGISLAMSLLADGRGPVVLIVKDQRSDKEPLHERIVACNALLGRHGPVQEWLLVVDGPKAGAEVAKWVKRRLRSAR